MAESQTVFVNQLPYQMTSTQLRDHFATAGSIQSADVKVGADGHSRGYGFVTFSTPEDARNAVSTFNGSSVDGRTIVVRVDQGPPARQDRFAGGRGFGAGRGAGGRGVGRGGGRGGFGPSNNGLSYRPFPRVRASNPGNAVFVNNLAWAVTWRELQSHFETAGPVARADVIYAANGYSKGCGIVEFATPEGAQKAIADLNGTTLLDRAILVREDRGDTRAAPEQQ